MTSTEKLKNRDHPLTQDINYQEVYHLPEAKALKAKSNLLWDPHILRYINQFYGTMDDKVRGVVKALRQPAIARAKRVRIKYITIGPRNEVSAIDPHDQNIYALVSNQQSRNGRWTNWICEYSSDLKLSAEIEFKENSRECIACVITSRKQALVLYDNYTAMQRQRLILTDLQTGESIREFKFPAAPAHSIDIDRFDNIAILQRYGVLFFNLQTEKFHASILPDPFQAFTDAMFVGDGAPQEQKAKLSRFYIRAGGNEVYIYDLNYQGKSPLFMHPFKPREITHFKLRGVYPSFGSTTACFWVDPSTGVMAVVDDFIYFFNPRGVCIGVQRSGRGCGIPWIFASSCSPDSSMVVTTRLGLELRRGVENLPRAPPRASALLKTFTKQ